ncbi:MAG: UDP-N-acetylglucosamine--N-acetylmuramyl-(pentapeptide) pyrophosphoryl-undecaprenol N-acetylglucosamine transferase [Sphaerospermopsis sp. SIO1G2]|nr:UDP-N-acetylglucosamine--N-acetylmuramyl-(pentapeptide) pyrophosphoryl-undecaprenol N-acetylglucosamine transferase [Sphaerospermopsis sp. SIO1G2]
MNTTAQRPIFLAAGGTGGHLYPALAVYRELKAQGFAAKLISDERGLRFADGFDPDDIFTVPSGGLVSGSPLKRLSGLVKLVQGWLACRKLLREHGAAGVVGLGGYGSVPPIFAASQMNVPSLLYQGDAVLGRANAFVSGRVAKLCLSFPQTAKVPAAAADKIEVVGAPMRAEIEALNALEYAGPSGKIKVLCVGGSLGAKAFASLLPKTCENLGAEKCAKLQIVQQITDPEDKAVVAKRYAALGLEAELLDYVHDMDQRLADCDLIIARSGGTTVHESAAAGRASIFIPLGLHADAQQKHNAQYLHNAGAAWIVEQNDSAASGLAEILRSILDKPDTLAHKAAAGRTKAILGAAKRIVELAKQEFKLS